MGDHIAPTREIRDAYEVFVRKVTGPFERPRPRYEDNIRMGLKETGLDVVEWIQLAQVRDQWRAVANTVMIFRNV
jgi:hypothetical protein